MSSARHQLILLGLLSMGLTWNDYVMPGLYTLAWALALRRTRRPMRLGGWFEVALLVAGIVTGHTLARVLGYSTHFAIGHGLAFLQLGRLLRPLNRREQLFSLLIAFFQLAVACTFLFDYRFLALLAAAVVLVPRAMAEHTQACFSGLGNTVAPAAQGRIRLALLDYLVVVVVMLVVFLAFPRGLLGGGLRLRVMRPGDDTTLLDTVLDPTRGGGANSRRILFQIRGADLGYLRCYSLPDFDGVRWKTSPDDYRWRLIETGAPDVGETNLLGREMRLKNPAFLGRILPVDGAVARIKGTFFYRAYETRQGMVEADFVFSRQNNLCHYWISRSPFSSRLRPADMTYLTRHPPPSPRLRAWLDEVVAGQTNALQQARALEQYFVRHFTYQLGAPDLNRLNPIEDFIFNQRAGHCERYAAALAHLLRLQGIPSRVVIGYLPRTSNPVSGWFDIRLRDAHAWTEAWIAGHGWVALDATPAATLPPPSAWSDWLEALDFAWYAHVVNFDGASQGTLLQNFSSLLGQLLRWLQSHRVFLIASFVALAKMALIFYWLRRRGRWGLRRAAARDEHRAQILAAHYYSRMLRALARHGWHRPSQQTPLEFLAALHAAPLPCLAEVDHITQIFCLTKYGGRVMLPAEQREIELALKHMEAMNYGKCD